MIISSEGIFHTIQGEGKFSGTPSVFIRLSYCNLRCEWTNADGSKTKCDTPHTSFNPEKYIVEIDDIISKLNAYKCNHVVITGGEPMMQYDVIYKLAENINVNKKITIETNGTYSPQELSNRIFFSISPKLNSSGNAGKGINIPILREFNSRYECQFKFVVNDLNDLTEICQIVKNAEILQSNVYLMPQGISVEQINNKMPMIFDMCKQTGFNYSDRLHIRAYGNKKGI